MLKKGIIGVFLLIIAVLCFAQPAESWYNDKPIVGINFKGLKSVSSTELDEIFKPYKGKLFSNDIYWEVLNKIYALDYFTDIKPKATPADNEYRSVYLEFEVTEKPSVKDIVFKGNEKMRKSALLSAATLKKGDIYNEASMQNDVQAIKAYYVEKGYGSAEVSGKAVEDKETNTVTIEYTVKEGKISVVAKIMFEGNTRFSEKALKKALVSKEAGFIQKGAFKEEALEKDKLAIKSFYGERGYADASVETIKKEIDSVSDPLKEQIYLTYVIIEGEQYRYTGTTFQGNYIFSSEVLGAKIKLKQGDIFNSKKFDLGFNTIIDLYFENGYTSNYFDKKEIKDEAKREIGFTIMIVENERSHIERIIIKGNKRTKNHVIERELLIKPGDVFSKPKFVNSLRNLVNSRYFSSVVPEVKPGSEQDLVEIVINVEEQSTANIQFGITLSGISDPNSFPLSVFAQWEEKNLLGTGRELSANVTASTDKQSLTTGFTENWLFGRPLAVGFEFSVTHKTLFSYNDVMYPFGVPDPFLSHSEFEKNPSLADAFKVKYDRMEFNFGVNTGYKWYPNFAVITLRDGINLGVVKNIYNNKLYRPIDLAVRNEQARWSLSNSIWTRISLDNRDFIYDPSKWWFFSQQFTFYGVIPKVENTYYFRSDTKAEVYIPLLNYPVSDIWNLKFVLAFYSGFTFQVPTGKEPIGYANRLYIDGSFNGRGWLGVGASGTGNVMQSNWIEFRWPLAHNILSFDFFFDAIAVKPDLESLNTLSLNDYHFSFGPGLRFSIPQFPLRLMLANTFRSIDGKPVWSNGKGANWQFVLSFNIPNL